MENKIETLRYYAYVKENNKIWVSNAMFNGLFSIDSISGQVEYHGRFLSSKNEVTNLHSYAGLHNGIIYFVPQNGKGIDFYDTKNGKMSVYKIDDSICGGLPYPVAFSGVINDELLVFPKNAKQGMIKYSFSEGKSYKLAEKSIFEINKMLPEEQQVLTVNGIYTRNKIWFAIWNSNKVVSVDFQEDNWTVYEVQNHKQVQTIFFGGGSIWLGADNTLIKWDPDKGVLAEISEIYEIRENGLNLITDIIFDEKCAYVIPQNLGMIQQIDMIENQIIKSFEITNEEYEKIEKWRDLKSGFIDDGKLRLNPAGRNKEVIIDVKTGEIDYKRYSLTSESIPVLSNSLINEGNVSLKQYLYSYIG